MNPTRHARFWLPLLLAMAACAVAPPEDLSSELETTVAQGDTAVSQAAVTGCRAFDGNLNGCNAAGCAYYLCSEQCHPQGTSYCNAGCFAECNASCRAHDGNMSACNAAGCAYYMCSNRCYNPGTSYCDAGCFAECNASCRTYDGNMNACNAAGCAYFLCSNRCYTKGTTLCEGGCTDQCSVPERNAAYISQQVPSEVVAGQTFQAWVAMSNNGAKAWSYDKYYRLGDGTRRWGQARGFLHPNETIWPGDLKVFFLTLTAPTTPGTYDFQWQMVKDGVDSGWFGQLSPKTSIRVIPQRDSVFVSQSVPTQVRVGASFNASVTMKNTGGFTWTQADGYMLGSQSPQDNSTWGTPRAYMDPGESIAPGSTKTFTWTFTAPTTPGTYMFQWQMLQSGVTWFGARSSPVSIQVVSSCYCPKGSQCPTGCPTDPL